MIVLKVRTHSSVQWIVVCNHIEPQRLYTNEGIKRENKLRMKRMEKIWLS